MVGAMNGRATGRAGACGVQAAPASGCTGALVSKCGYLILAGGDGFVRQTKSEYAEAIPRFIPGPRLQYTIRVSRDLPYQEAQIWPRKAFLILMQRV